MTILLAYDTETSGLPNWHAPSEDPSQPHIIELAAKLVDSETRQVLGSMNTLIAPVGFEISQEITDLTGITQDMALRYGVPMAQALELFIALWRNADVRVAHNESFDMRMLRIAIKRDEVMRDETVKGQPFADYWKAGAASCTASNSTSIVKLPPTAKMVAAKRNHHKTPNLAEAYQFFTGQPLVGAHRASADVDACLAVYWGIEDWRAANPA